jgi:large subunit ribosomal protein L25
MAEFIPLEVEKREVVGKQVKRLRREGKVPAVVYGPDLEPLSLSIDERELRHVLLEAGGTQLIELTLSDGKTIPTLARSVQRDPVVGSMLHVDFYQVSMNRPITAEVPVILSGELPMVETGAAVLIQGTNSLLIEALPAHLPPHIEVDITVLENIGDQILVGDLEMPGDARTLTDDTELVVKLDYPRMIEEEEEEEEELLFLEETPEVEVITERGEEEEFEDED